MIKRVNEEKEDGNFVIEVYKSKSITSMNKWWYITTEFSVSTAITIAMNIHIALGERTRVISRRSNNKILFDSI